MKKAVVASHKSVNVPQKYTELSFRLLFYVGVKLCLY